MKKKTITICIAALLLVAVAGGTALLLSGRTDRNPTQPQAQLPAMRDPIDDNYRTFYQIFVGSFSDSDGNGTGDLQGIIQRFDYLNDGNINSGESLGVQGIWLSPICSSPSYHKYDAADYYQVSVKYGKMEDLQELIALCKERNVKLILDLAINHTSDQHPWFAKFVEARTNGNANDPYFDYYTCVLQDEKQGGVTYQRIGTTPYWYECNFSGDMPELNYDNQQVRQEMLNVAKFYLDMGIDGFRFDAVKYIYYGDTPRSVAFWQWYMEELKKIKPDIYCVGECWSGETEVLEYYGAMNCFNFATSQAEGLFAATAKGRSIDQFTNYMESYQKRVLACAPEGMVMSFLSNHDMDRIAGSFLFESQTRMAANLYLLSSGSPVIYYGEEIGMRGSRGGANTDANRRLAMLWGDGDTVKNPVGSTYLTQNQIQTTVADQMADENSMYQYYCRLIAVRHKYPAIARGAYTALSCGKNTFGGFLIEHEGEKLGLFHNTSNEEVTYDLSKCKALSGHSFTQLLDAIGAGTARLEGNMLTVGAYTSVILG